MLTRVETCAACDNHMHQPEAEIGAIQYANAGTFAVADGLCGCGLVWAIADSGCALSRCRSLRRTGL